MMSFTTKRAPVVDEARERDPVATAEWDRARRAEVQYSIQLRKIARHVADIIKGLGVDSPEAAEAVAEALRRYERLLHPWAKTAARRMVTEVAARNDKLWRKVSAEMGRSIKTTFAEEHGIGERYRQLMAEQVNLITSIPREAAERVHHLVTQGVVKGVRFTEIAKEIERGGEVSKSRATLIARTETGRVVTALCQARAESLGSTGYTWRTMKDAQVRPSHKAMEGRFVAWDSPPTLDKLTGHAGSVPACRCYCEPSLPKNF